MSAIFQFQYLLSPFPPQMRRWRLWTWSRAPPWVQSLEVSWDVSWYWCWLFTPTDTRSIGVLTSTCHHLQHRVGLIDGSLTHTPDGDKYVSDQSQMVSATETLRVKWFCITKSTLGGERKCGVTYCCCLFSLHKIPPHSLGWTPKQMHTATVCVCMPDNSFMQCCCNRQLWLNEKSCGE